MLLCLNYNVTVLSGGLEKKRDKMSGIVCLFLFTFLIMNCRVLCKETGACENKLDNNAALSVWKNSGLFLIPIFGDNHFNE